MTTDLYKASVMNDGGVANPDDMSNVGKYLSARLFDQILAQLAIGQNLGSPAQDDFEFYGQRGANPPTSPYAYCLTPGGAYLRQGSANNKVQIAPGTLFQAVAAATGNEPGFLPYTFAGTEEVTIANGDVTHPRVDLIQMQLAWASAAPTARDFEDAVTRAKSSTSQNIQRVVTCTLSVKQGAPAASPVYPDPDAGCVAIGGVVVGTSYVAAAGVKLDDTAGAVAVLHDQRVPLGVRARTVGPRSYNFRHSTDRRHQVSAMDAVSSATGPTQVSGIYWEFLTSVGPLIYPVSLDVGCRITGYTVHINKVSTSGTITAQLYKRNENTGTETPLGAGVTYPSSSGYDELTETGLAIDISSTQEYFYVKVTGGGTVTGTTDTAGSAEIFWNRGVGWAEEASGEMGELVTANAAAAPLRIECPAGMAGRVVAAALCQKGVGSGNAFMGRKHVDATGALTFDPSIGASQLGDTAVNGFKKMFLSLVDANEFTHIPAAGPTVIPSATHSIGVPVWTSGLRVPFEEGRLSTPTALGNALAISLSPVAAGAIVGSATFFVAEGL